MTESNSENRFFSKAIGVRIIKPKFIIHISKILFLSLLAVPSLVAAQLCEETDPNVYFQVGSNGSAPHFPTPEEAGIENCSRRADSVFSRAVPYDPRPHPIFWGFLYCKQPTREYGVGEIFLQCCNDGQVLKDRVCVSEPTDDADENDGCSVNLSQNPCNIATGNKFRSEVDSNSGRLSFARFYNSRNLVDLGMGSGWRHTYQKKLSIGSGSVVLISREGKGEPWQKINGVWVGPAYSDVALIESDSGFEVDRQNNFSEFYDTEGRILRTRDPNSFETSYQYGLGGFLEKVSNNYGDSILFEYSNRKLIKVIVSDSEEYTYQYDSNDNLVSVTYPDQTPLDSSDNPTKTYHYENNPDFPNHLTGITDENGERYATFAYDDSGKAIVSELGTTTNSVGQGKIQLDYQGAN